MPRPVMPDTRRGAALLTVLLLVAVMSVIAVGLAADMRVSLARAANSKVQDQSIWHGFSVEAFADLTLRKLAGFNNDRVELPESWAREGVTFPLRDGVLAARLRDGSNCVNVNRVVQEIEAGVFIPNDEGMSELSRLLTLTGLGGNIAERLVGNLVDYIAAQRGADSLYALAAVPYRASGTLLADTGELRLVDGWDAGTRAALAPYLCAFPTTSVLRLNMNAIRPDQAAVLAAALGPDVSLDEARRIIENRPAGGFAGVTEIMTRIPGDVELDPEIAGARLGVSAEVIELEARVSRAGQIHMQYATLRRNAGGDTTLWRRRFEGAL